LASEIGICTECHTARDDVDRPLLDQAFQGGNEFPSALLGLPPIFPEIVYSSNITPHEETDIASYSVEDIVRALKEGEDANQDGAPLCPPMPAGPMGPFGGLTAVAAAAACRASAGANRSPEPAQYAPSCSRRRATSCSSGE